MFYASRDAVIIALSNDSSGRENQVIVMSQRQSSKNKNKKDSPIVTYYHAMKSEMVDIKSFERGI